MAARCPDCILHPGWATEDQHARRDPADVCRSCTRPYAAFVGAEAELAYAELVKALGNEESDQ